MGTREFPIEQLSESAERVNLLDFIQTLPEGFEQPVRERGAGFSTGQKQLISFARALAHRPGYLILDEATSSVDTDTELRIRDALGRLVEGRTSIVIAHRLSTIQRADRILVMHKVQAAGNRHASGVAGVTRHLLEAVPASIQGSGIRARAGSSQRRLAIDAKAPTPYGRGSE